MKKQVNGRWVNRFCDTCGRWCARSNRSRYWTKLTGKRLGNEKEEPMHCPWCLPPKAVEMLIVRRARLVEEAAAKAPPPRKPAKKLSGQGGRRGTAKEGRPV